ncbi:MAG: N-6 DNA methylase [Clostridia bacterium]|nr:N-6 DNA methylase [Clostridia bacterium]
MIDLYLLCADLKNSQSEFKQKALIIISQIFSHLNHPTSKTKKIIEGWKEEFRYVYGDITTNLSSNSKLKKHELLELYGICIIPEDNEIEALQLLFFSIQTFFSLLTKYIMKGTLQGIREENGFSYEDIILGEFAKEYGITNYCVVDWYCWPLYELEHGFSEIMEEIHSNVENYQCLLNIDDFQLNNNYDFIKQIYEAIIPKELRHALGEYYTPDWLAEFTLKSALKSYGEDTDICKLSIVDPTCGSGTYLFKSIAAKRKAGCGLSEIITTVCGIDINPLAVLTAKTNYLLSIIDLIDGHSPITLPVYIADVVKIGSHIEEEDDNNSLTSDDLIVEIMRNSAKDKMVVNSLEKADVIIGNPPWVNWEYMPEQYRQGSQHTWIDYNLFSAKGRELSFSKEDISVLITYIVMDKLLKDGGVIGFVIRQGVFKSAQNGVGFRRFRIKDTGIKVIKVDDLSKIRAFENATNSTALFFAKKGLNNVYPVPYFLWEKRKDLKKCSFGAYSQLQEVMSQVSISQQCAMPAVKDDITSLWITTDADSMETMKKVLGTNNYRARTGVFTGGANAVYWLNVNGVSQSNTNIITITNIVERAKRKAEQITTDIEKDYVFPMLKGSNVRKWNFSYDTYLLCPHTAETKMWPVPQKELVKFAPLTMEYLLHFKEDLDARNGFAGWEKEIQQQEFHSILRIGDYTFSKYKVIWKYIASEFICAVISSVDDKYLGEKPILPNEKIMYVSTDDETEAYYLCGILSSTVVAECVKSYMNPTSISAHVLNKLNIPLYDSSNSFHREIAALCKAGHGKDNINEYIGKIDQIVGQLYEANEKC